MGTLSRVARHPLFWILLLAACVRLFGIGLALTDDEAEWAGMSRYLQDFGEIPKAASIQPPLYLFSITAAHSLLPSDVAFRLLSFAFGLLTIAVFFFLAQDMYGKRTATIAAGLLAILFYHVFASLQVDKDGSMLLFFLLSSFYTFRKSFSDPRYGVASGILLGLAMLTKYTAIGLLPVLLAMSFFKNKYRPFLATALVFLAVFISFPLLSSLLGLETFSNTIKWGSQNLGSLQPSDIAYSAAGHVAKLLLYATPLLFLSVLFVGKVGENEKSLYLWLLFYVLLVFFIVPKGDVPKTQTIFLPPLTLLAARMLSQVLDRKWLLVSAALSTVFFFGFVALYHLPSSQQPVSLEGFRPEALYTNAPLWVTSFAGPLFSIPALAFVGTAFLGSLSCAAALRKRWRKHAIILLFSVSMGFNAVLLEEFLFYSFSPDYSRVVGDMTVYYADMGFRQPLFTVGGIFPYYFGAPYNNENTGEGYDTFEYHELLDRGTKDALKLPGTAVILSIPPIQPSSPVGRAVAEVNSSCRLEKTFFDKGRAAGYIWSCGPVP